MIAYTDDSTLSFPQGASDSEKRALLIAAIKEGNEAYINPDYSEKQLQDIRHQIGIYKQQLARLDEDMRKGKPAKTPGFKDMFGDDTPSDDIEVNFV